MNYFNQTVNRKQEHALKWMLYPDDVIPLWIADSDYPASPAIHQRLSNYAEQTVLGYQLAEHTPELNSAALRWLKRQYDWQVDPDWLVWVPGVMVAVNACVSVFGAQGIAVQTPNYPPILNLGNTHDCTCRTIQTIGMMPDWQLDLTHLEDTLKQMTGGLLVVTNPMNPCGVVYTKDTLETIADLCQRYDITVCSDEVHADLILDQSQHVPAASLDSLKDRSVTIMSASKTFNVAGLATAFAVIPNETMRKKFYHHTVQQQFWVNPFGMQATIAAYTESDDWYEAQREHLSAQQSRVAEATSDIEGLNYSAGSATYLAWIDATELATDSPHQYFLDRKVGMADGADFGMQKYLRLNFACPEYMLAEALERMAS